MSKTKAVSDEEVIAALLQHGTIREAAEKVGLTPRAIYNRMDNKDFRSMYLEAKTDIVREAVYSINTKLGVAVDAVFAIMNDQDVNPAVRLQAAQVLISNAAKFSARLTEDETASREMRSPYYFG